MTEEASARPLLTIAIPTYNREKYLGELLSILFPQIVNHARVELIISDNASTDGTTELVQGFKRRGLAIRYFRNETSLGMDGNFLRCYEHATGTYFWMFGDDDVIDPGGVDAILGHLQAKEYDLIYVESYPLDGPYQTRPRCHLRNALEIVDSEQFVKRVNVFVTFISGNIVNRDRVEASRTAPYTSLCGTNLLQLGWIYTALNGFTRGLYIKDQLVAARVNNTGGYKVIKTFGPDLSRITSEWLVSSRLKRLIINGTVQRFWPGMLIDYRSQAASFESEEGARAILTPVFGGNFRYWFSVYPILVLPAPLATAWHFAVRVLNRIDKAIGFILLR